MKSFIIQIFLMLVGVSVFGQKRLSSEDSIIIKFLITQGQFPDLSPADTSDLRKELNSTLKKRLAVVNAPEGTVSITAFAANISHSHSYVLVRGRSWYIIIGDDVLENNILKLNALLKNRRISLTKEVRLACYDLLIGNVADRPESPQLMDDDGCIK